MDELTSILPRLTESQIDALRRVARAMVDPAGAKELDRSFTARQFSEMSDLSERSISQAMADGRLSYTTPLGQSRPRYATVRDFEEWSGKKVRS